MNFETILYEKKGPIGLLTLNRRDRLNAINQKMLREINSALDAAEKDEDVRVIVVTGSGSAFSSGFDLKEQMERRPTGVADWRPLLDHDFNTVFRFWKFSKPTIAAVRGACLAGACELALCCDLTIATDDAFFGEPELKFGAGIVVMILPWIVGPKIAKEIILTGEDRLTAARAREIGIVNQIVPSSELESACLKLAKRIAVVDPNLVRQTKHAINRAFEIAGLGEALEAALDIDLHIEGEGSPDKIQFMEIARRDGLRAALAWREQRFAKATD
jgi:enoyl-CoA hydratase